MDFLRCNNPTIGWYVRMLTDPLPVHPNIKMLSELCMEDATLEAIFDSQLPH